MPKHPQKESLTQVPLHETQMDEDEQVFGNVFTWFHHEMNTENECVRSC